MHAHRAAVEDARRAAVLGDHLALRSAARELSARGSVQGIPADARPWLADLRRTARAIEIEPATREAVRRTAFLARHCGGCHEQVGAETRVWPPDEERPDPAASGAHIQGADWALRRLWDGVAGPSEDAWRAGRELLAEPATFGGGVGDRPIDPDAAARAVQRLAGMAWVAGRSGDPDERARLLGDVMVTCADCHAAFRGTAG